MGKECDYCNRVFDEGDLVMKRAEKYFHTFPSSDGDELDCDSLKQIKDNLPENLEITGEFLVYHQNNFHHVTELEKLENYSKISILPRRDYRGSKLEGSLEGL